VGARTPSASSFAKAQISLEALMLFALFLAMLAIVLASSSQIRGMAQNRTDAAISQQAFNDFSSKAGRACALGDGNVRVFSTQGAASISGTGSKSLVFTMLNITHNLELPCDIGGLPASPSNSFTIENKGGTIEIT